MGQRIIKPFSIKVICEGGYNRLYVTHPTCKGRIKKRVGVQDHELLESIVFHLKYDLENHFADCQITLEEVSAFIDNYISLRVKFNANIFKYFDEFVESKKKVVNKRTKNRLVKATITSYESAKKYFIEYLEKSHLAPHPNLINQEVLDNFYYYIKGRHNYKVKLHRRIKAFISFLDSKKGIQIDPTYKFSVYTEEYDNQDPEDDDIALTADQVQILIALKQDLENNKIAFPMYPKSSKIPEKVQQLQFHVKKENLIRCLDCFLFMASTGMYHSDIQKTRVILSNSGDKRHLSYKRAKNGNLCRAIPVMNNGIFISKQIIEQYNIQNGKNFPLNLSNTHFNKHLERISELAGFNFKLNNKMARKTFASIMYFNNHLPIHLLQVLLGHKNVSNTAHYLRISSDSLAEEISMLINRK